MLPTLLPGMTKIHSQWAFRLMKQEAQGVEIVSISQSAWREALSYDKKAKASEAFAGVVADGIEKWIIPEQDIPINDKVSF